MKKRVNVVLVCFILIGNAIHGAQYVPGDPFSEEPRPLDERHTEGKTFKGVPGDQFGEYRPYKVRFNKYKPSGDQAPRTVMRQPRSPLSTKPKNPVNPLDFSAESNRSFPSKSDSNAAERTAIPTVHSSKHVPESERTLEVDSEGVFVPTEGQKALRTYFKNQLFDEWNEEQRRLAENPVRPQLTPLWPRTKKLAQEKWDAACKLWFTAQDTTYEYGEYMANNPLKSAAFAGVGVLAVYGVYIVGSALYKKIRLFFDSGTH